MGRTRPHTATLTEMAKNNPKLRAAVLAEAYVWKAPPKNILSPIHIDWLRDVVIWGFTVNVVSRILSQPKMVLNVS